MPYFLFRISPNRTLTLVNTFDRFQDAKSTARQMRAAEPQGSPDVIRMIFAESARKAQLLLTDARNPRTDGDD